MKKVLSVFLAAVMLFGCLSVGVVAASDKCIKLSETSGSSGYSAGSDAVNAWVRNNNGGTLIFDVKLESVATPPTGMVSRLVTFTGADPYNYAGYDFTNKRFVAGAGSNWPTAVQTTTYNAYSTKSYNWKAGDWHEIAYQFDGTEATVYFDGIPMVSAELDQSFDTEYIILYPQYCTVLIDNLRICGKDYNVRDRYGDVYATNDFNSVTNVKNVSNWVFDGAGYSVSTAGRSMPELSEMLPARTVSPAIDGTYLKYSEASGVGVAASGINFTAYNGFTYVENVRIDRKSVLACMGVRFGEYIAGYDWDTGTFRISNKALYGFNTTDAYTYASVEYALSTKTVYELAVRACGNSVSVYLNGVLMVQAVNDAFAANYANVDVVHYRMGASIDNVVVAHHDYNVREAEGSAIARFTFDEASSYIDGIWDYNLDKGNTGYSIAKATDAAAVTITNAEADNNKATMGITLANCTEFTSFKLDIAYDSKLSVAQAIPQSILNGSYVLSQTTKNPLTLSYIAPVGKNVPDGKIVNITFNTPSAYGEYNVTVTVTPFANDVECASFSAVGTVSVPEPDMNVGLPEGLEYDGEYLTWIAPDTALGYDIYVLFEGDEFENYIDFAEDPYYYFPWEDYIGVDGLYTFRVYMYDDTYDIASVSEDLDVVIEADGNIISGGLYVYANVLCERLSALVEGKTYSADNQALVDGYLTDATYDIGGASDYITMSETYAAYAEMISDVPVKKDIVQGIPTGLAYDGTTITWTAAAGATAYDVYMLYEGNGYEYLLGQSKKNSYAFFAADNITEAGLYTFRVYMYDSSSELAGVSDDLKVVIEADGTVVAGGLSAYAEILAARLTESVAGNEYTDENRDTVDSYLADAAAEMAEAVSFAVLIEIYDGYAALLADVPVGEESTVIIGDVNGDGAVNNTDVSLLSRFLKAYGVEVTEGADIDGDGAVNNIDLSLLKNKIKKQ